MIGSTRLMPAILALLLTTAAASAGSLEEVATSTNQWTGIAVSAEGRIFVNFPRWSLDVPISVGELQTDGKVQPFPNRESQSWAKGENAAALFVCVQSVHVDSADRLWILDPASPYFQGVVPGGPKLLQVDLQKNKVVRTYDFDEEIAPQASYLNDVRVDVKTGTAFITDSGMGALVVLDLSTGQARRVLAGHPSALAEDIQVNIGGRPFPGRIHADGIALDAEGGWLYWQALTGRTLYQLPTAKLNDENLTETSLAAAVEVFAESGVSDGLLWSPEGIYVSALEEGSIKRVSPDGKVTTIVQDERIVWPDSFARGPDGSVYFTTAQIHLGPNPPTPYRILRIPAP